MWGRRHFRRLQSLRDGGIYRAISGPGTRFHPRDRLVLAADYGKSGLLKTYSNQEVNVKNKNKPVFEDT